MAGRRCDVLDVREMLRRLRLGQSARAVAKGLGVSRNTVREYVAWFEAEKLLSGDAGALPAAADLYERLARSESVALPPRLQLCDLKTPNCPTSREFRGARAGAGRLRSVPLTLLRWSSLLPS
ncbi:MAG TPA: hypothetical protein VMK12_24650 [Anaeromyxobacteraceae bacterium]|nr:hypothetical protein [Anaeromyxobacteraceae bacterium]